MMNSKPIDENQNAGFGIYGSGEETMRGRLHHRLESLRKSKSAFCLRSKELRQDVDRAGVRSIESKSMSTTTLGTSVEAKSNGTATADRIIGTMTDDQFRTAVSGANQFLREADERGQAMADRELCELNGHKGDETMADIYTMNAEKITVGLQGSVVCDEAIQAAKAIAADRDETVRLEDDGELIDVHTDGTTTVGEPWE